MLNDKNKLIQVTEDLVSMESLSTHIKSTKQFGGLDACSNDMANVMMSHITARHSIDLSSVSLEDDTNEFDIKTEKVDVIVERLKELKDELEPVSEPVDEPNPLDITVPE